MRERGKKKAMARKVRGRSQRAILFNHGDTESTEKLIVLRVFVSPWLIKGFMIMCGFEVKALRLRGAKSTHHSAQRERKLLHHHIRPLLDPFVAIGCDLIGGESGGLCGSLGVFDKGLRQDSS